MFDIRSKLEENKEHVIEIIQESGQVIFVPTGWYHQVHNLVGFVVYKQLNRFLNTFKLKFYLKFIFYIELIFYAMFNCSY